MGNKQTDGKKAERLPGLLPAFLLLALLLSLAFADAYTYEEETIKGEILPYWELTWIPLAGLAVLICGLINGLLYGIGHAINNEPLMKYARSEMLQTAATAVMIVVMLTLVYHAFDFAATLGSVECGGEDVTNPIEADMCFTQELLNSLNDAYENAFESDWGPEIAYSISISVLGFPVFIGSQVDSIYREVETYHSIAYICINLMIGLSAKMFVLKYIYENMLSVFLPLGIILRTFHFTRGIGAFFIALAIAFYFIYPLVSFILSGAQGIEEPELPPIITTGMCNIPVFGSFSFGSAALSQSSSGVAAQLSISHNLASFISDVQTKLLYSNMVAFGIAITFLRYATTILGGDTTPFMGMVSRLI